MSQFHSPADQALNKGRTLFQPKRPGFWLVAVMLLVGSAFGIPSMVATVTSNPLAAFLGIVLVGVFAGLVTWFIVGMTYTDTKPTMVAIGSFALGALFATALAPLISVSLGHLTATLGTWSVAVSAATSEETYKALCVVAIFLTVPWWFNRVIDGLVVGAIVGLGFQTWEDVTYITIGAGGASPDFGDALTIFFDRVILNGIGSHAAFTAVFGAGLAYAVTHHGSRWRSVAAVVGGFGVAWTAHAFWDSPILADLAGDQAGIVVYSVLKSIPILVVIFLLGRVALKGLHRAFTDAAVPEIDVGLVDAKEVDVLVSWQKRGRRHGEEAHHVMRAETDLIRLHLHSLDNTQVLTEQHGLITTLRAEATSETPR